LRRKIAAILILSGMTVGDKKNIDVKAILVENEIIWFRNTIIIAFGLLALSALFNIFVFPSVVPWLSSWIGSAATSALSYLLYSIPVFVIPLRKHLQKQY